MGVTIHHFQAQIVSKKALLGQMCPKKNQNSLQHPKTAKNRLSVYVSKSFLHIVQENIMKLSSKYQIIIMKPKYGLRQPKWVKMGSNQPKHNLKQPISRFVFVLF